MSERNGTSTKQRKASRSTVTTAYSLEYDDEELESVKQSGIKIIWDDDPRAPADDYLAEDYWLDDEDDDEEALASEATRAVTKPHTKKRKKRDGHFGRVPTTLLVDPCVSFQELRVYAFLTTWDYKRTGKVFCGQVDIAKALGTTDRTVRRALRDLEARGAIESHRGGPGRVSTYLLLLG